jgi:hypothetical protein
MGFALRLWPFDLRSTAIAVGPLLLAACSGSGSTGQVTTSPAMSRPTAASSPAAGSTVSSTTVGPLAVLVQRAGGAEPYVIQLVRPDGRALPAVHAVSRSLKTYYPPASPCPSGQCRGPATANYQLPETSVSATHVYFLDGESDLKSLSPSGTVALIRHLAVEANSNVAFAVSPDDRRIAIAVVTYAAAGSATSFDLRLYAEDLLDGGHRTEVYTSASVVEWPVGWHAGEVVLAIGDPGVFTGFNPYGALEYHLVDPASWTRQAVLSCTFGPLVVAGSACSKPPALGRQDWTGAALTFRLDPTGPVSRLQPAYLALSPDGHQVAGGVRAAAAVAYDTELFEDGSESLLVAGAAPSGWLDARHLLVTAPTGPAIAAVPGGTLTPVTGLAPLPGQGWPSLLGVLPAFLG